MIHRRGDRSATPGARLRALVLAAGLLTVLAGLAGWWWSGRVAEPSTFGAERARQLAESPSPTGEPAPPSPASTPSTPVATTAPSPSPPPPVAASAGPVREIQLPAQGIRAPVVPVGVAGDGTMEIPEDVRTAGWYRFGPAPGDARGSVVISGHINDRDQGSGAFAVLAEVDEGERVVVTMADGRALAYRVIARERFDKAVVPMDRIFDRGGAPRLTLVTCGGAFDRSSGNYRDNVVVTAVPDP